MPRRKILYVYRFNYLNEVFPHYREQGKVPRDFLYGMQEIDGSRFEVAYVNAPQGPRRGFARRIFFPIELLFSKLAKLGWPLEIFFLFRRELRSAQHVFCVNDPIGLALLFWKRLGMIRGRVYLIVQSAHERCRKHFRVQWFTRRFIGWLLRAADGVFVLAECAKRPTMEYFHVDPARIHHFPFGGDGDFWTPADTPRGDYVMSIGNDLNRDYRTLVSALRDDERAVILTTKSVDVSGKHVELKSWLSNEAVRDCFQHAAAAVIPSEHVVFESSGYSSAFQAALTETPLIVSDSPPMREVFTEWEHALFYESENPAALRRALDWVREHPDEARAMAQRAREHVLATHSARHAAEAVMNVI